ncbi:MAG: hypothetical protein M3N56_01565, partial [Actinomycetota bacterium]|nr:hypothetical protein [Actinomycetota bacterium]
DLETSLMTDLAAEPLPAAASDSWTDQLNQLKAKYRNVRPAILAALTVLLHNESVTLEDAKAQAAARGFRITAASINGARTLLEKMDAPPTAAATPTLTVPAVPRAPRRPRAAQAPLDAEAMIRSLVDRMQGEKNAEVERLRDALRKAIAVLQAAVG